MLTIKMIVFACYAVKFYTNKPQRNLKQGCGAVVQALDLPLCLSVHLYDHLFLSYCNLKR